MPQTTGDGQATCSRSRSLILAPLLPLAQNERKGGGEFSTFLFSLSSVLYTCPPSLVTQPQKAQAVSPPASLLFRSVRPPSPHSLSLSLPFSSLRIQQSLSLSFLSRPDGDEASWPANRGRTPIDRERAKSTRGGGGGCCETTHTQGAVNHCFSSSLSLFLYPHFSLSLTQSLFLLLLLLLLSSLTHTHTTPTSIALSYFSGFVASHDDQRDLLNRQQQQQHLKKKKFLSE